LASLRSARERTLRCCSHHLNSRRRCWNSCISRPRFCSLDIVVRMDLARFVPFRVEQPNMQYFAARAVSFRFLVLRSSTVVVVFSSILGSLSFTTFDFSHSFGPSSIYLESVPPMKFLETADLKGAPSMPPPRVLRSV